MNLNINDAFDMAAKAHEGQKRKFNGSSYIEHLHEVFKLLAYAGVEDEGIFIAGILHGTLKDTTLTEADIKARFGTRVSSIVQSLTDDKTLSLGQRKSLAIEKVKVLSSAALIIKLADLISNISAIPGSLDEQKITVYIKHCSMILEAAKQNPPLSAESQKLLKLADFFLLAQTAGSSEYSYLCELVEQGLLYWCDEEQYFVIANYLVDSLDASKLVNQMLEDAFYLGLFRGITLSKKEPKLFSIAWEQALETDMPVVYGTPQKALCQRVVLTT